MKFSLVLATVGRSAEVARFLASLDRQTYRQFEIILVDQNLDDRVHQVLAPYRSRLSVVYLRTPRGLSRARNVGLRVATGDVFGFPDDDCWYPPHLLESVARVLASGPWDGVAGRAADAAGRPSGGIRWPRRAGPVSRRTVWRQAISFTVFLRRRVIEVVGDFDETLGAGSEHPWQSGEETDYLLRAMRAGFRLLYDPALVVYHDPPSYTDPARGYHYGMGLGRVLRKHRYSDWFAMLQVVRPAIAATVALARRRPDEARFRWAVARGRLRGWIG